MNKQNGDFAIETVQLTKVFPDWWGRSRVKAVQDLNLRVHYNEIYGFLGPNGSGKTTTIKMLLNLLYPTRGHAFVLGGLSSDPEISARIGYLPEESYLYRYLTAEETLDFYGRIFGLPGRVRKDRIDTLLEMVGLAGMGSRAVGTFSKGMMRRIGLAQALINDPDLLILDEPTSGLDPMGTRQIKNLIVELSNRGKTILLCSHLLADMEDVCDRIGILYGGRMQVEGPVGELLQHRGETQIRTGSIGEETLGKIRELIGRESELCEISAPMDKLENFFINTVIKAQEQQPTSGAQVGTGISGFLAEEKPSDSDELLRKLASASVEHQPTADPVTEKSSQETPGFEANELLQHLMHSDEKPEPVTERTKGAQPKKPAAEPVRRDLLDELTGKKSDGTTEKTGSAGFEEDADA